ncbi:MAG: hypothetical protein RR499_07120 [Mucinivorans sp.]
MKITQLSHHEVVIGSGSDMVACDVKGRGTTHRGNGILRSCDISL